MTDIARLMSECGELVEERLAEYLSLHDRDYAPAFEAMRYGTLAAGKRLRPFLTLSFCESCGGDTEAAIPFACAVELIHSYSLIHDDLPCMDNSELRRGKPSCHKKYGEAQALLAGDALLTHAFHIAADNKVLAASGRHDIIVQAVKELSLAAGVLGMVGGQWMDMQNERTTVSLETLKKTDSLKTGALIRLSARLGVMSCTGERELLDAADAYASLIGLAFQITDDILDATGCPEELGKPVGGDVASGKSTYVSLLGLDRAQSYAAQLVDGAKEKLSPFVKGREELEAFADFILYRKH
jgi:geranylgeranyl diphosphate synthase type II